MPLIPVLINLLLPVAVNEVKKKIEADTGVTPSTAEAAPIAAKAAAVGLAKSKTSWFAVALLILGFLEQNQQLLSQFIPSDKMGLVISGIGFFTLLLRTITTTSVVEKAEPKE